MMIVLDVLCRSRIHESEPARSAGCVCPVDWGQPYRRYKPKPQGEYVRGRTANMRGPHRRTVAEPDEIAVERFVGGDRDLTLAKVERDAAIDHLDRYGLSARQVAVRLGVTMRTVQRRRSERRRGASAEVA